MKFNARIKFNYLKSLANMLINISLKKNRFLKRQIKHTNKECLRFFFLCQSINFLKKKYTC